MKSALRFLTAVAGAAALSFVVSTSACTPDKDPGDAGPAATVCTDDPFSPECHCVKPADCDPTHPENRFKWICTASHKCVRTCTKNADCRVNLGETCEDAVCR